MFSQKFFSILILLKIVSIITSLLNDSEFTPVDIGNSNKRKPIFDNEMKNQLRRQSQQLQLISLKRTTFLTFYFFLDVLFSALK